MIGSPAVPTSITLMALIASSCSPPAAACIGAASKSFHLKTLLVGAGVLVPEDLRIDAVGVCPYI